MNDGTPIIIKKKKVVGHGGHHGGSWKVAYADFVTAMMAFFMVMWILGLSDSTKAQIQGYFNDPLGFTKNEPKAPVNIVQFSSGPPKTVAASGNQMGDSAAPIKLEEKEMKAFETKLKQAVADAGKGKGKGLGELIKNVDFTITSEGLRIELVEASGAVFFETGCATIRPEARKLIARMVPLLIESKRGVKLEGHTDSRPYANSNGYDNWDLSGDRAQAVRRLLKGFGMPNSQFLDVRAYADRHLRIPSNPYHYSNRRVTILLPFHSMRDQQVGLPKEELKDKIQGVFRRPIDIAPDRPDIVGDVKKGTKGNLGKTGE
jgi:chemotaxis protein MotB